MIICFESQGDSCLIFLDPSQNKFQRDVGCSWELCSLTLPHCFPEWKRTYWAFDIGAVRCHCVLEGDVNLQSTEMSVKSKN